MQRHPRITTAATAVPGTINAVQHGRKTAAIHEHQYLFASIQPRLDRLNRGRGDAVQHPFAAKVDEMDRWQRRLAGPVGKTQFLIAASLHVAEGFQRRCRRTQHDRYLLELRALNRDVSGMIAKAILLFERQVVLLIDDDHPQPR